jgi:hypothetical protein
LARDKEPLRFGSTRAKFARGSVRYAARGNMVSTLRGKATSIASRGSRAQSIPGFNTRKSYSERMKVRDFTLNIGKKNTRECSSQMHVSTIPKEQHKGADFII